MIGDVHQLEPVYTLSIEDDKRVQKAARVDLSVDDKAIFRVFEVPLVLRKSWLIVCFGNRFD